MATWYTAAQNTAAGHTQYKIQYPLQEVVRADGKFPYRPGIVCPRPQRKYEAHIGLKSMERQAARTASEPQHLIAKWSLGTLVSRAQSHLAHWDSSFAVANCALCRTSTAGRAGLERASIGPSTNPMAAYPIIRPSTLSSQTPGRPRDGSFGTIAEVTPNTSRGSDMRPKMMYRDDLWAPTARQPLLPDRDAVATNGWHEACKASLGASLEDEE